jgi:hypothetical protein
MPTSCPEVLIYFLQARFSLLSDETLCNRDYRQLSGPAAETLASFRAIDSFFAELGIVSEKLSGAAKCGTYPKPFIAVCRQECPTLN